MLSQTLSKGQITLYTTTYCPYCTYAKDFLTRKNLPFREVDVTNEPSLREALVEQTKGRTTVPQIFIGDVSIGGYDDLVALAKSPDFEKLLKNAGISQKNTL